MKDIPLKKGGEKEKKERRYIIWGAVQNIVYSFMVQKERGQEEEDGVPCSWQR